MLNYKQQKQNPQQPNILTGRETPPPPRRSWHLREQTGSTGHLHAKGTGVKNKHLQSGINWTSKTETESAPQSHQEGRGGRRLLLPECLLNIYYV